MGLVELFGIADVGSDVDMLRDETGDLRREVSEMREEIRALREEIDELKEIVYKEYKK